MNKYGTNWCAHCKSQHPRRPCKKWPHEQILQYWIAERTRIYEARRAGHPWPWSNDPIFQTYAFTNVSRHLDKATKRLRMTLDKWKDRPRLQMFAAVAFRAYNRITTWDAIEKSVIPGYDSDRTLAILEKMSDRGEAITSNCWLVVGAKNRKMYESQLDPLDMCWENLDEFYAAHTSLAKMHEKLKELPRIGAFIGQEILMDLTYETRLLERAPDRKTYVYLGPGSIRFLRRARGDERPVNVFATNNDLEDRDHFWRILKDNTKRPLDNGYKLTIHDVEHCLCETHKYIQALTGGHVKRRYIHQENSNVGR